MFIEIPLFDEFLELRRSGMLSSAPSVGLGHVPQPGVDTELFPHTFPWRRIVARLSERLPDAIEGQRMVQTRAKRHWELV
jgi:hypothetical protein